MTRLTFTSRQDTGTAWTADDAASWEASCAHAVVSGWQQPLAPGRELVPEPDWPAWTRRYFPDGIPASDALAYETPASDAQMQLLRSFGVHDRWCTTDEASALITPLMRKWRASRRLQERTGRGDARRAPSH